jgi:hypothetical protein
LTTATSTPPTREGHSRGDDVPRRPPSPRKRSWAGNALIVALVALVTAGVLVFAGMFDSTASKDINIDPVANTPTTARPSGPTTAAAPRPADPKAVVNYTAKMKAWNECMKKHTGEAATKPCGEMPAQGDDPNLNAYLADVLEWNKCAAPLLKHGALTQAEAACGPQPSPATGD